jgi:diacylglycerol kinase (ATP)
MDPAASPVAAPHSAPTFIIVNPFAGHEDASRTRRRLGGAFAELNAPFDLLQTTHPGHAAAAAREAARLGYRAVVVCGGDGTLAEAATGLGGSSVPLGLIPRGTGNQVAHNLGIPLAFNDAVNVAVNGHEIAIDLGRIGERAFALVAGAGFDAAVMRTATRELKERWGFGAYIYAAVREALTATPQHFRITADERTFEVDAVSVLVANVGELFAGWLPLRFSLAPQPTSAWHDGMFDVVIVAPRKVPDVATILWRAAHRQFTGSDRLVHFQAESITIDADPPIAVQVDGDPAGETPVSMTVLRNAMRIMVPG